MGFRIGRLFRRVFRAVDGLTGGLVSRTLGAVIKPFKKALELLGKVPFLGKILPKVLPILAKLGPLAFLAGGPAGLALGLLCKAGTIASVANMVGSFVKCGGGLQNMLPQGLNNVAEGAAWRHAQLLRF